MANLLTIENAQIIFRNFSGKPGQYNREGNRNFCVIVDEDVAEQLREDGWNVKEAKPRYEDDDTTYYIQVKVNFDSDRPPKVIVSSNGVKTRMDEETIDALDSIDFQRVDLTINPYFWHVNGKSGVNGYLKTMLVEVALDPIEQALADEEFPV